MNINNHIKNIRSELRSARGQKFLQFTLFIFISFIFWFALTLNEEFRHEITYPIKVSNTPDSITLISNVPNSIKINISAKGYLFLKNKLKPNQIFNIDFSKYRNNRNCLQLGNSELQEITRDIFGTNNQINSFSIDSINIFYTNKPGKIVALKINATPIVESRYIINSPIKSNLDKVALYSIDNIPDSILSVETEHITCDNLNSTTIIKAKVIAPKGIRVIPDSVDITIPVEPLISKRRVINIDIINSPEDCRLIIFPSQVEINYLIPKSLFNKEVKYIKASVDYNDISQHANKLPIYMSDIPSNYRSVTCSVDSVEYIIEQ